MNRLSKRREKILITGLVLVAVVLVALCIVLYLFSDREAPVITINDEYLNSCDLNDEAEILKAVSAVDDKTKNVEIIIVGMVKLDGNFYKISFSAKDEAGNSAMASTIIENDTVLKNNRYLTSDSDSEPDTSAGENESAQEAAASVVEETTEEVSTEEIVVSPYAPVITLTTNKVSLKTGDAFNYMDYIESITDDEDEESYLYRRISIEGYYNTKAIGNYNINYSVKDSDGNKSRVETLLLIVRDN